MPADDYLTFSALGPLEVRRGGVVIEVGAAKLRTLLACLLLRANLTVTVPELIDAIWDEPAPKNARGTVQKYVMRLRRMLGNDGESMIRTEADGYRIVLDPAQLDLNRFRELVAAAHRASEQGDLAEESTLLRESLSLWRAPPPLSNVVSSVLQVHDVPQLVEQHLQALERRIEIDLHSGEHSGEHSAVATELLTLISEHPLRERFWAQRIRALAGTGRQGEAFTTYQEIIRILADELGVGPGHELRAAYQEVLIGPEQPTPAPAVVTGTPVTPRQLPTRTRGFVGRSLELEAITTALSHGGPEPAAPMVVIAGPAGVGKTTLAVHAAHHVDGHFPDGQLFVDLRGHAADEPLTAEQVLGQFLRSLGLGPEAMPLLPDDQIAVYRSLLAGRRMLVVLDNAGGEDQVRRLLPGAPGCAVIVTSRFELAGLAVDPGAQRVELAALSTGEAEALLREVLDTSRLATDERATSQLIGLCGHLPLALRLTAAHLLLRPELPIAEFVTQLRSHGTVNTLGITGDDRANLAAAFDWSYRQLPPDQQRTLKLLTLVPGPDFTAEATAALTGHPAPHATRALELLAASHLVDRRPHVRYHMHDLVREYAATRCQTEESQSDREEASERLLTFYLTNTDAVTSAVIKGRGRLSRPVPPSPPTSMDNPLDWLDQELPAIIAAVRSTAEHGPYQAAYHLADALAGYFMLRGRTSDWHTVAEAGLRAARRARSEEATAAMLNNRGILGHFAGQTSQALADQEAALEIYQRLGSSEAHAVRIALGSVAQLVGKLDIAIAQLDSALTGCRAEGDPRTEILARQNLVQALLLNGDLTRAQSECELLSWAADRPRGHVALGVTGMFVQRAGDLRRAAEILRAGSERAGKNGDRRSELGMLCELATCYLELGEAAQAHRAAASALANQVDPRFAPRAESALAAALSRTGQIGESRLSYRRALRAAHRTRNPDQMCEALTGLAELELEAGNLDLAAWHAAEAVTLAGTTRLRLRQVHATVVLAGCQRRSGTTDQARQSAQAALATALDCAYPLGCGMAHAELGNTAHASAHPDAADRHWREADHVFATISSYRTATVGRPLPIDQHGA